MTTFKLLFRGTCSQKFLSRGGRRGGGQRRGGGRGGGERRGEEGGSGTPEILIPNVLDAMMILVFTNEIISS